MYYIKLIEQGRTSGGGSVDYNLKVDKLFSKIETIIGYSGLI